MYGRCPPVSGPWWTMRLPTSAVCIMPLATRDPKLPLELLDYLVRTKQQVLRIASPIAFAVFRLMTRPSSAGCPTGRRRPSRLERRRHQLAPTASSPHLTTSTFKVTSRVGFLAKVTGNSEMGMAFYRPGVGRDLRHVGDYSVWSTAAASGGIGPNFRAHCISGKCSYGHHCAGSGVRAEGSRS